MPRFSSRLLWRSYRTAIWLTDIAAAVFFLLLFKTVVLTKGLDTVQMDLWTGAFVGAIGVHVLLKISSYSLPPREDAPRLDWID